MSKARYQITQVENGLYDLFEDDVLIARFSRKSFREDLHCLGRGNGWIGSILRLLNRVYPAAVPRFRSSESSPSFDDILHRLGERGIAEYLRFKGYAVYKPLRLSVETLINYLLTKGYAVEMSERQHSPLKSKIVEINNGCESGHSGAESLCPVGEMQDTGGIPTYG